MNRKLLAVLLPCAIGIPMLVFNLGMIGTWAGFEEDMGKVPTAPAPIASVGKFISGAWFAHQDRSEREEIFDATAMTIKRTVEFSRHVTIEDVLRPGETVPRPEFHHLYILARAPAFAMDECPRLLAELATTCVVGRTSVEPRDDGAYRLTTHYVYLPEQPFGDISQIARATLDREQVDLTPDIRNAQVAAADLPALRLETYRAAMLACENLRQQTGSCAIGEISFDQTRQAEDRPGYYEVKASAALNWLKVGFDDDKVALNEDGLVSRISGFLARHPSPCRNNAPTQLRSPTQPRKS